LATDGVASNAVEVVTLARLEVFHGPSAPFFRRVGWISRSHAAPENEVSGRTGDGDHAGSILVTHLVVDDVGDARCYADDAEIVVASTLVAVVKRIMVRPALSVRIVLSVASSNLSDASTVLLAKNISFVPIPVY